MEKKCFKCGVIKRLSLFYRHKMMADGHLGKCKSCTKKDVAARYADPTARERIRAYDRLRFKNPERKRRTKIYRERARARNAGKWRARQKLSNAVRDGRVLRRPCEKCGDPKSQGHHTDYRKPFQVQWLCFKHHREAHGQIIGTTN